MLASIRFSRVRVAVLLLGLAGCDGPPTAPELHPRNVPARTIASNCDSQIFYNPESGCPDPSADGSETSYSSVLSPDRVSLSVSSYSDDWSSAPCPRDLTATVVATIRSKSTGRVYNFHSTGTWMIDWIKSIIYLPSSQAIYSWPAGFWPAFDRDDGHYALIKIGSARGLCRGPGQVDFFTFYDVVMDGDDPKPTGSSDGSDGDGGGPGLACHTEYIHVEINDGNGWYVYWEGNATVCE
jgi:hypothetical protein